MMTEKQNQGSPPEIDTAAIIDGSRIGEVYPRKPFSWGVEGQQARYVGAAA